MKIKNFGINTILFPITLFLFLFLWQSKPYQAATSYTNAKEFYESTGTNGKRFHAEVIDGTIYYATCAKLASSGSSLHYSTVGFDIALSGNGHSVSFSVKRIQGSMKQIGESVRANGYEYILYAIDSATLFDLATKSNSFETAYVLDSSYILVTMDAILITQTGNQSSGGISEDGNGGITHWGTIYRLKNPSDLATLKSIFSGHSFTSYYDIQSELANHQLLIRYHVQGLAPSGSTIATVNTNYSILDGLLFQGNSAYLQKQRILQRTSLLNPSSIALEKTGYHLLPEKEWITNNQRIFSTNKTYMPSELDSSLGQQDLGITLYANWQPNTYTINYDANGGSGIIASSTFTFDQSDYLRANTFSKIGFYLESGKEWNTAPDGSGTSYGSEELVTNLLNEHNSKMTLYANWKPLVLSIDTDKKGGRGGTATFYEGYHLGFFSDQAITNSISSISTPTRTGYTFAGYYLSIFPSGEKLIDKDGTILIPNTYFLKNAIIYADYSPKSYQITFDKQGGRGGSDFVYPLYDSLLPFAEAPFKDGTTFKGYFTKPNGQGTMYYNEFMAPDLFYQVDGNITLYAYWIDETPPEAFLTTNIDSWTNRTIQLTASAIDYDSGLASIQLYANNQLVADHKNLNGLKEKSFTYQNTSEGVINYHLVAIDKNGNKSETSRTIYYDKKSPTGTVLQHTKNGNTVSITLDVTDINVP